MNRHLPRLGAALALTTAALLLSACAPETQAAPAPASTGDAAAPTDSPAPATSPEANEPVGDPTCENIIDPTTVADFESIGWSARADPFYVGSLELEGGLQCMWADLEGPATDHLQMFGVAPITDAEASAAEDELVGQGWVRKEGPEGVYVTENADMAIATDDEGFGMTYLFADGWVKLADTKQGLLLITWP